jgi:hypothetical protein
MKKQKFPTKVMPAAIKVDNRGQRYLVYPDGQIRRIAPNGTPLPRLKMSKKERLKLRREYREIEELDRKALANKIIESPVINPASKSISENDSVLIEEPAAETTDA